VALSATVVELEGVSQVEAPFFDVGLEVIGMGWGIG